MAFVIVELWHYMIDSFGNYIALDVVSWYVPSLEIVKLLDERNFLQVFQSEPNLASGAI